MPLDLSILAIGFGQLLTIVAVGKLLVDLGKRTEKTDAAIKKVEEHSGRIKTNYEAIVHMQKERTVYNRDMGEVRESVKRIDDRVDQIGERLSHIEGRIG